MESILCLIGYNFQQKWLLYNSVEVKASKILNLTKYVLIMLAFNKNDYYHHFFSFDTVKEIISLTDYFMKKNQAMYVFQNKPLFNGCYGMDIFSHLVIM